MASASLKSNPNLDVLTWDWRFRPHRLFRNQHAMTIVPSYLPRRYSISRRPEEARRFEVAPGVPVLGHCHWQPNRRDCATLIIVHGMEGSSNSRYALGTADKAFRAGYNTVRYNLRNCGGTEHLSPSLYNAGQSADLAVTARLLAEAEGLREIYFVGFSLGGNLVLKLAAEYGKPAPYVRGVFAISPAIDLPACIAEIELPRNRVYQWSFVNSMKQRMRRKLAFFPGLFDPAPLAYIQTIREFDDIYTAPEGGFDSAEDYYTRVSAAPRLKEIRLPTVMVHAADDPFIPFSMFAPRPFAGNPFISFCATDHGGHVGFVGSRNGDYDSFWVEHRVVDFVKYLQTTG